MVELGFISVEEAEKSYLEFWPEYLVHISEIAPTLNTWSSRINRAPWFTEYIRRKLIKKYGEEAVYDKGLLVYTTLDIKKQDAGRKVLKPALMKQTGTSSSLSYKNEDYINDNYTDAITLVSDLFDLNGFRRKGSRKNEKVNSYIRTALIEELEGLNLLTGIDTVDKLINDYKKTYRSDRELQKVEGCIISINQKNGYIEALIGGSEFSSINQLNRVIQMRRQPGSAIKPLLYASAIESKKFTAASTVLDSPVIYLDNEGGDWLPENYEGSYYGLLRLRKALAMSINVISIRVADQLGIDYIMKYYGRLLKFNRDEIKKRIPRNFSIALGSLEVSPFELTRAYAIIANGGRDVIPFSIKYIKDRDGKILENREKEVEKLLREKRKKGTIQVINPDTAQVMINMLRAVVSGGTGGAARPGRDAAGKTGTTNNFKDAWFVGFVPQLTTGIWVGYDRMGLSLGIGQSGGAISAPLWGRYMRQALKHEPVHSFPSYAPLTYIEVCSRSGLLPSSDCKHLTREGFISGTVPEKECDLCAGIKVDIKAAKKGPRENISKKQKRDIYRNIKKSTTDSILNNIEDDLLDDD
jgi:penicillin-binding protein 1A